MPAFVKKSKNDLLRNALQKIQKDTKFTSIGPGSIIRALSESVSIELSDLYSILDYNTSMTVLSTAQGRALDLLGEIFNVKRKTLTSLAATDQRVGLFYFYIDEPHGSDIRIPAGTRVSTSSTDYVASQFTYVTEVDAVIPAGRFKSYTPIRPNFNDSIFTAGKDTVVNHNYLAPTGVTVKCINPKPISPVLGFEQDDNYRTRIIAEIRSSKGGTTDALRFTALAVHGVRDVKVRNNPYGLATSEVLIIPEDNKLGTDYLSRVRERLLTVAPVGIRVIVREPTDICRAPAHK